MPEPLTVLERRVLGVLVEKALTSSAPEPLSLNAVITGCNQKSNRDPVLNLEEPEVDECLEDLQKKGLVFKVTGGRVEWETMKAQVQVVTEQIGSGRTTVQTGPAQQLGPQDFLELQRMNRIRRPSSKLAERIDGKARPPGSTSGPHQTANDSAAAASGAPKQIVMKDDPTKHEAGIRISTDDIVQAIRDAKGEIRLRPVWVCVDNEPLLRWYDLETGGQRTAPTRNPLTAAALAGDGKQALTIDASRGIDLWEVASGAHVARLRSADNQAFKYVDFAAEGRYALAHFNGQAKVRLWRLP